MKINQQMKFWLQNLCKQVFMVDRDIQCYNLNACQNGFSLHLLRTIFDSLRTLFTTSFVPNVRGECAQGVVGERARAIANGENPKLKSNGSQNLQLQSPKVLYLISR